MLMLWEHVTSSLEVVAASLAPPAVNNVNNNILLLRWTWAGGGSPLTQGHLSNCWLISCRKNHRPTRLSSSIMSVTFFFGGGSPSLGPLVSNNAGKIWRCIGDQAWWDPFSKPGSCLKVAKLFFSVLCRPAQSPGLASQRLQSSASDRKC